MGDLLDTTEQLVTISAVLLGALTTHVTSYLMERQRNRHELLTRWDTAKLDAYEGYVDRVRASIFLGVELYEHRTGLRESDKAEQEMSEQIEQARRLRGRAFERVLLLGGDDVVEVAHELNAATTQVDWQATGKSDGSLADWRERNRAAFARINDFHETARVDLGVQGSVTGERHPQRDLLLSPAQRNDESSTPSDA
jgi:sugar phosphate isomerase/epimerase